MSCAGLLDQTRKRPTPGFSANPPALKLCPAARTIESPAPVAVIFPLSTMSPVKAEIACAEIEPTFDALRVNALASFSDTAPALVMFTVEKSLVSVFSVALLEPISSVNAPAVALNAPLPCVMSPVPVIRNVAGPPVVTVPEYVCAPTVRTSPPLMLSVFEAPWLSDVSAVVAPTALPNVRPPAPAMVSAFAPLMAPDRVSASAPVATPMVESVFNVTAPASDAVPVAVSAPLLPTPTPLSVTASLPIATPLMFSVAPLLTVVPPSVLPSALAFAATSVPPMIVVAPVYVFAPDSVSVPAVSVRPPPAPPMMPA